MEDSSDELGALERSLAGVAIELQKLLDRLRYESARREAILSGMTEGVLAVDHELRVTFCNTAFLRAIDFRGARFEGRFLLELVRDPGLHELLRSVLNTGEPQKLRFKLSAANARTFEVQATPLEMPSGRGAIAILHDITDLERLEQVRKDFVANVSHELRTPLAGIIGYADTLLDGALEDQKNNRQFVEIIRTNAVRLSNIAADLLILSELESGMDHPAEPDMISVRGVLEGALATVASEARSARRRPDPRRCRECVCERQPSAAGAGDVESDGQRDQIQPARRRGSRARRRSATAGQSRSPSPIPASESLPRICREFSSGSIASTKPAPDRWAEPVWVCRS